MVAVPLPPPESASEAQGAATATTVVARRPVLAAPSRHARSGRRTQVVLGCAGLAFFAVGATVATAAARADWVPPPEISVGIGQVGTPIASVDLGSAAPLPASLEVVAFGHAVWSTPLSSSSGTQTVAIPPDLNHSGSYVVLVTGGKPIRFVAAPGEA